ncbi:hypothetical protein COHA_001450 [Chlorella ohadii]|uniref:Uncharacterized protein n=1 Tax=Chlorella ohadii TaxID=2649997 RepID=A0AAD5DZE9_9CHLO|nr:hypothetical protein COHA_001450 [Chlorella ohadii]
MERFTAVCEEPARHQAAVLRHLLHLHRATTHLRRHGIQLPADFGAPEGDAQGAGAAAEDAGVAADAALRLLRQLPLTTYGDYAALIDKAVEAGRAVSEADPESQRRWEAATAALTGAQPVYAFWCSSGTTGGQKRLPASMHSVTANIKAFGLTSECNALAFPLTTSSGKDVRFSYAREVEGAA